MSWLQLQQVSLQLGGRTLLDHISLAIEPGQLIGLIGPNGAGKSSLLKAIAHLLPYQGHILLDGQPLAALDANQRALRLAYLAQGDDSSWPLRLYDYVALGRLPHRRRWGRPGREDRQAIAHALDATALVALAERRIDSLSGGERARARLARALAVDSRLLLADEPVAALDPYHQLNVMQRLREQCQQGRGVLVVLHDLTLASRFCDQVILLDHGRVVEYGSPRRVLTPKHLQQVYKVQAMLGEHQQQRFVLPWSCRPEGDL